MPKYQSATGEWVTATVGTIRQVAEHIDTAIAELRAQAASAPHYAQQPLAAVINELEREVRALRAALPPF